MGELSNRPGQGKSPERSQRPLWFVIVGLLISLFSSVMQDEMIGHVVFWFGIVFAVIALMYWLFQPKHGMRRR